jgi:hypothetical protein
VEFLGRVAAGIHELPDPVLSGGAASISPYFFSRPSAKAQPPPALLAGAVFAAYSAERFSRGGA